jgi:transcriptional pleiotropic regulator of transition state genes
MKEVGIARRVDDLGRIVLPAELRRLFGINAGDAVDIAVDGDAIVLRKVDRACVFCDGVSDLRSYRGRPVCAACRAELSETEDPGNTEGEVVDPATG